MGAGNSSPVSSPRPLQPPVGIRSCYSPTQTTCLRRGRRPMAQPLRDCPVPSPFVHPLTGLALGSSYVLGLGVYYKSAANCLLARCRALHARHNLKFKTSSGVLLATHSTSFATSSHVRQRMQAQRTADTVPEKALRSCLHRRGIRYRLHVRPLPSLPRTADIVFPSASVALFEPCHW
jgi:hypothetical protein